MSTFRMQQLSTSSTESRRGGKGTYKLVFEFFRKVVLVLQRARRGDCVDSLAESVPSERTDARSRGYFGLTVDRIFLPFLQEGFHGRHLFAVICTLRAQ